MSTALPEGTGATGGWQLDMSQQCALAAQKTKRTLGCSQSSAGSRQGGAPAPLLCAVTPHLEHCVHRWSPQGRRDVELLERCVQRRDTEMVAGMEALPARTG